MKTHGSPARALNPVAYAAISVGRLAIPSILEDSLDEIARNIRRFYDEKVVPAS